MSTQNNQHEHKSFLTYLAYIFLIICILLLILMAFNMDLCISYFSHIGSASSFGAFIGRFGDLILAILKHTFNIA